MRRTYVFFKIPIIVEILLAFGCNDKPVQKIPSAQTYSIQQLDENTDSTSIIEKLYAGKKIIKTTESAIFSFDYGFDSLKTGIRIICRANILKKELIYTARFKDSIGIDRRKYNPNQEHFYINSSLQYKNIIINLDSVECLNCNSTTEPLKVWASDGLHPTIKAFKTPSTEVILIRGLNFYCNGRYCSNYEVIGLVLKKQKMMAFRISYPGIYPLDFYNTFLFEYKKNKLCMYSIKKDAVKIKSTKDFIIVPLLQ